MVAYTGDYDDDVLKRVASTEAAIGQAGVLGAIRPERGAGELPFAR